MNKDPKPINITSKKATMELVIEWDDGHTSRYSFSLLRSGCPCADCRGGHDNMGPEPDQAVFNSEVLSGPKAMLKAILPVGTYAINPIWEDGHEAGIFSWHYLRKLCPCPECRVKK